MTSMTHTISALLLAFVSLSTLADEGGKPELEPNTLEAAETSDGDASFRILPLMCTVQKMQLPPLTIFKRLCPEELRPDFDKIADACDDGQMRSCERALQKFAPNADHVCGKSMSFIAHAISSCL
ncbi:MAG: hypothetical protein M3Q07_05025 [Pseudobdellovibrionaceae bacterium]|nr:hypothetical protein [Pseudobdellovibrionaceae bacterium]